MAAVEVAVFVSTVYTGYEALLCLREIYCDTPREACRRLVLDALLTAATFGLYKYLRWIGVAPVFGRLLPNLLRRLSGKAAGKADDAWRWARGVGKHGDDLVPIRESISASQLEKLKLQYAAEEVLNAERIGSALKADASHRAASFLSREQLEAGKLFNIRGGDGVQRQLLQTARGMNDKQGIFEFILEPNGYISHQRFIEKGAITGIPDFPVRKLPR